MSETQAAATVVAAVLMLPCLSAAAQAVDAGSAPFQRGVQLEKNGDWQGARRAYEETLRLSPGRVDALSNLGAVHLRLGNPVEAVSAFRKALARKPEMPSLRFFLALALYQAHDAGTARKELAPLLKAQPADGRALHLDALCLLKLNQLSEGTEALQKVVSAQPGNRAATITLATAYVSLGETGKAEELLGGSLRGIDTPETQLVRGMILNRKAHYREAAELLTRVREANPKLPTVHNELGYTLMLLGDYPAAQKEYEEELRLVPGDFNASANLGWILVQERDFERAEPLLTQALRQKPDAAGLQYLMGQVLLSRGEAANAASLLESAVRIEPSFRAAHVLLARAYARLNRPSDAARVQTVIAKLTEEEQVRNGKSEESYGNRTFPMPNFQSPRRTP